jgi:hypothetical protein
MNEAINSACRDYLLDKDESQLEEILKRLTEANLPDVACLIQALTPSTIYGGSLMISLGENSEKIGLIPYSMRCITKASDVLNDSVINNEKISQEKHNVVMNQLKRVYRKISQGNNYYDETKQIIQKETQKIVVTMTTCKRLDLFIKTVRTFLACCTDISLIDAWYVVDDNSSEYDREVMKKNFPWIVYTWKNEKDKGHAKSMNILREIIPKSVEFIIHLEDDWYYAAHLNYISKGVAVLKKYEDLGQILFNANYHEQACEVEGEIRGDGLLTHRLHHFSTNPTGKSDYWPHFSLRPGIIRKKVWDTIPFDETAKHFEMDYAYKYISNGWKTGFFNTVTCIHTGKNVNSLVGTNAYELNNQIQFSVPTILPIKLVLVQEFGSIKRILKRSMKLKPKFWLFSKDSNDEVTVNKLIGKNLAHVNWDVITLRTGEVNGFVRSDKLEITKTTTSVVVNHDSIQKVLDSTECDSAKCNTYIFTRSIQSVQSVQSI